MTFIVPAGSYDRFMGRFSAPLAPPMASFAGVAAGQRVLDVGCGPGALTGELVTRVGADLVTAVDPSPPFVEAIRLRFPEVTVIKASAERLPFAEDGFDAAIAQLVVHHMADAAAGIGEMARVTRPGGVVAACVWDFAGGRAPLSPFWEAVRRHHPDAANESDLPGAREGHLVELLTAAGLDDVTGADLAIGVPMSGFDEWWAPFPLGVGPAGGCLARLDTASRAEVEASCRELLPDGPFTFETHAWAARGRV